LKIKINNGIFNKKNKTTSKMTQMLIKGLQHRTSLDFEATLHI